MQPKINFKKEILSMSVGESIKFPIESIINVRVMASNVGLMSSRRYKTETDRENGIVLVTRLD